MSKILALATTGFGKTIAAAGCQEPENGINIEGLPRDTTYWISVTSKPLPFRGSARAIPVVIPNADLSNLSMGRRVITNDAYMVAKLINKLAVVPHIQNIVVDDAQYLMMDYMMSKSLATGWDAPKKVGHFMSEVFAAMELAEQWGKNIFMLAHYDEKKKDNQGNLAFKMKTTGNSVEAGVDPEGKFDITLYGKIEADPKNKKVKRYFITNNDGTFNAKSAPGMFPFAIPNDLGYVLKCVQAYYNGDPRPQSPIDMSDIAEIVVEETLDPVAAALAAAGVTQQTTAPLTNFDAAPTPEPTVAPVQAAPIAENPAVEVIPVGTAAQAPVDYWGSPTPLTVPTNGNPATTSGAVPGPQPVEPPPLRIIDDAAPLH